MVNMTDCWSKSDPACIVTELYIHKHPIDYFLSFSMDVREFIKKGGNSRWYHIKFIGLDGTHAVLNVDDFPFALDLFQYSKALTCFRIMYFLSKIEHDEFATLRDAILRSLVEYNRSVIDNFSNKTIVLYYVISHGKSSPSICFLVTPRFACS